MEPAGPAEPPAPPADGVTVRRPGLIILVLCSAQLILAVDVTIVNVANASIQRALGFTAGNLVWTVSAYSLTFGGFLLLGGRLADLVPRRRLLIIGVGGFALASIGAGSSQTTAELISCRLAQGLFAAVISPTTLAFLASVFEEGRIRQRAYGLWATSGSVGGLVGLLVGGVITSTLGWRWIFFINGPFAAIAIAGALILLPNVRPVGGRRRLDVPGAVSVTLALALIVYGLGEGQANGWRSPVTLATLTIPVFLIVAFLANERRVPEPLLPLALLKRRATIGNVVSVLQQSVGAGTIFLAPLFMQEVFGYPASRAGAGTLPLPLGFAIGARISSRIVGHVGARRLVTIGFLFMAAGLVWLARTPTHGSYFTTFLPGLTLRSFGQGLSVVPTLVTVTSGVREEEHGIAAGLYNMSQQMGGAIGVAAIATVAAAVERTARGGAVAADAHGMRVAFVVAAVVSVVGAGIALTLPRQAGRIVVRRDLGARPVLH